MTAYNIAVQTLLEYKINTLPVTNDIICEIIKSEGFKMLTFNSEAFRETEKSETLDISTIAKKYKSFTYYSNNLKIVFYKQDLSYIEKLFALSHELGHIKMGHFNDNNILGLTNNSENPDVSHSQEQEANLFMLYFLAPCAILKKLNIKSAEQISRISLLDIQNSNILYSKLKSNQVIFDYAEKELCKQFQKFIDENKYPRILRHKNHIKILIILLLSIINIIFFQLNITYKHNLYNKTESSSKVNTIIIETTNVENQTENNTSAVNETNKIEDKTNNNSPVSDNAYITKTGKKYHKIDCRYVNEYNILVSFSSSKEAEKKGYEPCKICFK